MPNVVADEQAREYADHFFQQFKRKMEDISFEEHVKKVCKFDSFFYEEIIAENLHTLEKSFPIDLNLWRQREKRMQCIKIMKNDFLASFKREYLEKIKEEMDEQEEELNYAISDKEYYEKRQYIGEEEDIGGEVTEEERNSLIRDGQRSIEKHSKELEILKRVKEKMEK